MGSRREELQGRIAELPETQASLRHVLGLTYGALSEGDGVALLRQAYQQRTEALGPDHPETLESLFHLARLEILFATPEDSRKHLELFVERAPRGLGAGDKLVLRGQMLLPLARTIGGDVHATDEGWEILARGEELHGPQDPNTLELRKMASKGFALTRLGRHEEAEAVLVEAWEGYGRLGVPQRRSMGHVDKALVDVYEATGRADEASRWMAWPLLQAGFLEASPSSAEPTGRSWGASR